MDLSPSRIISRGLAISVLVLAVGRETPRTGVRARELREIGHASAAPVAQHHVESDVRSGGRVLVTSSCRARTMIASSTSMSFVGGRTDKRGPGHESTELLKHEFAIRHIRRAVITRCDRVDRRV